MSWATRRNQQTLPKRLLRRGVESRGALFAAASVARPQVFNDSRRTYNMNATRTSAPLLDAFYELSLAQPMPDAGLLDEIIARYPEHADALTAFAAELAMDANSNDAGEDGNEP